MKGAHKNGKYVACFTAILAVIILLVHVKILDNSVAITMIQTKIKAFKAGQYSPSNRNSSEEASSSCSKASSQKTSYEKPKYINSDAYFGTTEWRQYYPEVANYLSSIEDGFYKWPVPVKNTTSAKFSTLLQIKRPLDGGFKVGDILRASIQAKNGYDEDKSHGGDYFHVRLLGFGKDGKPNGNSLAPQVEDCGDGRYDVIAPLLWSGESRLLVELVHSSEAVAMLINRTTGHVGPGITFYGTYVNGEKKECNVGLRVTDPLHPPCNFSHPDKGVTWYCYPTTNGLCTSLKWLAIRETPSESIKLGRQPLFTDGVNWRAEIRGSGAAVHVTDSNYTKLAVESLPPCGRLSGVSQSANDRALGKVPGFYMGGRWVSLQCKNADDAGSRRLSGCFKDKILYFIGDSTLRQWYLLLAKLLPLRENDNGDKSVWQRPRRGSNVSLNTTVHYIGHGSPLHGLGPPSSRPYVVDTLNGIRHGSGKGVYVVFNMALHFYLVDTEVYIARINAIRRAVDDLIRRSPDVTVLVRGCLRHKISKIPVPSEWFSFRLCKILRAAFAKMPGVGFVDTWPMTSAKLLGDTHPDDRTVAQHVALFASYVCPVR